MSVEYISAKDAAVEWGISQRRVAVLCSESRIAGATVIGNMWLIPRRAKKPVDARSNPQVKLENLPSGTVRPFLKWAGGKSQLLDEIRKFYPFENSKITKYAEPFIGGGAVLFDILSRYTLEEVYISDTNAELINTYYVIKDDIDNLVSLLAKYQSEYVPLEMEERSEYYAIKRERFNELKIGIKADKSEKNRTETSGTGASSDINLEKAALTIFLNHTCFNGLYRVNRKGLFNVPMGKYKNPLICDEPNLREVSKKLQNVTIVCGDFKQSADFIDEHTFAYFDPPYRPLTVTSAFTAYTENAFDDDAQKDLADFARKMSDKGAKVLLSNSDPNNADPNDNFFDNLYSGFNIRRVSAARMINSKGSARGKISELLISNYNQENIG